MLPNWSQEIREGVSVYCAGAPHQMLLDFVNMGDAAVYLPKEKVSK